MLFVCYFWYSLPTYLLFIDHTIHQHWKNNDLTSFPSCRQFSWCSASLEVSDWWRSKAAISRSAYTTCNHINWSSFSIYYHMTKNNNQTWTECLFCFQADCSDALCARSSPTLASNATGSHIFKTVLLNNFNLWFVWFQCDIVMPSWSGYIVCPTLNYKLPYCIVKNKVKFSDTRYRALGTKLMPLYRQSAYRWIFMSSRP